MQAGERSGLSEAPVDRSAEFLSQGSDPPPLRTFLGVRRRRAAAFDQAAHIAAPSAQNNLDSLSPALQIVVRCAADQLG